MYCSVYVQHCSAALEKQVAELTARLSGDEVSRNVLERKQREVDDLYTERARLVKEKAALSKELTESQTAFDELHQKLVWWANATPG